MNEKIEKAMIDLMPKLEKLTDQLYKEGVGLMRLNAQRGVWVLKNDFTRRTKEAIEEELEK